MVTVRERTPADDPALARLFEEMQAHYQRPCPPVEAVLRDLAALPPGVTILVAEVDTVVGFAVFSPIYPGPGLASGLFLKELFVSRRFRRSRIGTALMRAVASARTLMSIATACAFGRLASREIAMHPLPVPRSRIVGCG